MKTARFCISRGAARERRYPASLSCASGIETRKASILLESRNAVPADETNLARKGGA
jgi:hypothetical protein